MFTTHYSGCEKDKSRTSGMGVCRGGHMGQGDREEEKGEGLQASMQFTTRRRRNDGRKPSKTLALLKS